MFLVLSFGFETNNLRVISFNNTVVNEKKKKIQRKEKELKNCMHEGFEPTPWQTKIKAFANQATIYFYNCIVFYIIYTTSTCWTENQRPLKIGGPVHRHDQHTSRVGPGAATIILGFFSIVAPKCKISNQPWKQKKESQINWLRV